MKLKGAKGGINFALDYTVLLLLLPIQRKHLNCTQCRHLAERYCGGDGGVDDEWRVSAFNVMDKILLKLVETIHSDE